MAAQATLMLFSLAALCLPALANIPRTPLIAEKPHQGGASFAPALHRGPVAANPLIAPGMCECVCDFDRRSRNTGKERDAETGLDYFGARYFSGAQGRFTSPDRPFADQRPQDPQSWNLYAYGRNNPLLYVDPSGNCTFASDASQGTPASAICADAADLRVSGDQINAIKGNEGKMLEAYIAPEGFDKDGKPNGRGLTVGYGHLVKPGEKIQKGDEITEPQANALLVSDVEVMAAGVRKAIGNNQVSQQEFDAMVDMAFGIGSLSTKTTPKLLKALEKGDYDGMAKELRTDQATNGLVLPGLQKRSTQRENIFLNGNYAPVPPPAKKKQP